MGSIYRLMLIGSPFFGNEVYGFPGCMSISKWPHDIVGFSSKAKMEIM